MLTDIFTLDSKVAVYVPSTNNVSEADAAGLQSKFVDVLMAEFSRMFGGATTTAAMGGWMAESGQIVTENVQIVYSFCTGAAFEQNAAAVVGLAKRICKEMKQEAVTLEYNNRVAFITA